MTIILACISSTIHPPSGYAMTFSFIPLICILFWSLVAVTWISVGMHVAKEFIRFNMRQK